MGKNMFTEINYEGLFLEWKREGKFILMFELLKLIRSFEVIMTDGYIYM